MQKTVNMFYSNLKCMFWNVRNVMLNNSTCCLSKQTFKGFLLTSCLQFLLDRFCPFGLPQIHTVPKKTPVMNRWRLPMLGFHGRWETTFFSGCLFQVRTQPFNISTCWGNSCRFEESGKCIYLQHLFGGCLSLVLAKLERLTPQIWNFCGAFFWCQLVGQDFPILKAPYLVREAKKCSAFWAISNTCTHSTRWPSSQGCASNIQGRCQYRNIEKLSKLIYVIIIQSYAHLAVFQASGAILWVPLELKHRTSQTCQNKSSQASHLPYCEDDVRMNHRHYSWKTLWQPQKRQKQEVACKTWKITNKIGQKI